MKIQLENRAVEITFSDHALSLAAPTNCIPFMRIILQNRNEKILIDFTQITN
jgi:hypothetical protein